MDAFKSGYEWIIDMEKKMDYSFRAWFVKFSECDRNSIIQRLKYTDDRDGVHRLLGPRMIELDERIEKLETLYETYQIHVREKTFLE